MKRDDFVDSLQFAFLMAFCIPGFFGLAIVLIIWLARHLWG